MMFLFSSSVAWSSVISTNTPWLAMDVISFIIPFFSFSWSNPCESLMMVSNSRCSCLWFCRIFTCCCCHLLSVLHLNCHCVHASFCSGWFWWSLRPLRCLLFCFCPVALLCFILWCCRPVSFLMLDFQLVLLREPWRRKWCWCCCWMCWCLLCDGNLLFLWWCCFFFHGLLILDCIADVSSSSCVVMPLSAVCFGVDVALGKMKCGL